MLYWARAEVLAFEAPVCHRARTEGARIGGARYRLAEAAFLQDAADETVVHAASRAAWRRDAARELGSARRLLHRLAA